MRPASLCLALLLLLPIVLPAADGEGDQEGQRKLAGSYTSAFNDRPNRVRATFFPTDEPERWRVRFDFSFNNTWRTWNGHAEGSFDSVVQGLVRDEDNNRAFTFRLEADGKRYKGTHYEVIRGRQKKTGTLDMKG